MKNPIKAKGFTLVELLVVIVIIAVLAALSLMGFGRFRNSADASRAMSTLRQLQVANTSYSSENNGRYCPVYGTDDKGVTDPKLHWHENTKYLALLTGSDIPLETALLRKQNIPPSLMDPKVFRQKKHLHGELQASYGMNHEVANNWGQKSTESSVHVSSVVNPSRTCAFISSTDWIAKYSGRFLWRNSPIEGKTPDGKIAFRHDKKAMVVYYDGHVGTVTAENLRAFERLKPNKNNQPFWTANAPE